MYTSWSLEHRMCHRSQATRYYVLTARLLARRLEMSWVFNR